MNKSINPLTVGMVHSKQHSICHYVDIDPRLQGHAQDEELVVLVYILVQSKFVLLNVMGIA